MKLEQILKNITYSTNMSLTDLEVSDIVRDSRQVEEGSLFFAIEGVEADGHSYAQKAIDLGATAVVVQRDMGIARQILVESTHREYGVACGNYYGNPAEKLKLIGVTGTNGKTTVTYIVKGILEACGKKVGLIGTIENIIGDVTLQARHTTPDPHQLHAFFARMVKAGCEYVIMEVSSHALDQERVAGCQFTASAFTNLSQDHLDYHGTMEKYFEAKKKLFAISDTVVINLDDAKGEELYETLENNKIGFSCEHHTGDITAHNIKFTQSGSNFAMLYKDQLKRASFIQPGLFSVSNALAATGLCLAAGLSFDDVVHGLSGCPPIPGRFEIIPTNTDFTVIRDFAHSPDGLEKLLTTVREVAPSRVVTIFGCAGERDRSKRSLMAEIASKYSDYCIMTADNPRSEPIEQILQDALPGLDKNSTPYEVFTNRYDAIQWALKNSKTDDYLILAGKGHEDYQVLDYGSVNFNERQLVLDMLESFKKDGR